jgi:hypothetical protein
MNNYQNIQNISQMQAMQGSSGGYSNQFSQQYPVDENLMKNNSDLNVNELDSKDDEG